MATLHENRLLFNSNVTVSHSGGNLSSDSGLILVKEFMDKFKFSRILRKNIQIQDNPDSQNGRWARKPVRGK